MKWYQAPIVVIDFESTGFRPPSRIVEVGAVRYENGFEVSRLARRCDPQRSIEPGATEVHKITNADVDGGPVFADIYRPLADFCRGAIPASYGSYDKRVLHQELDALRHAGHPVDEQVPAFSREWGPWLDLLGWARKIHPGPRGKGKHTLQTMATRYGVDLHKAHCAVEDAAATGELLWHWRDMMPDVGLTELMSYRLPG